MTDKTKTVSKAAESSTYIPTIGLEIHAELKTASKMFCGCVNNPDEERPNANTCPICLGHPGTLPVPNKQAISHVLAVGTAVKGEIADFTEWDRKHYFYPDIPKGYQISQYKYPLVKGGEVAGVKITRIHLEEDTAKSTHDTGERSLVDFNRSGVPLMELVTEPVIHDAQTAVKFAKELQLLLRYLGAGEANLEKGEMRVEANISISKCAVDSSGYADRLGTKTEIKNLNSFRAVERAIEYEIKRQTSLLDNGEKIIQETRGWDENAGKTFSQRAKESSHDYRYYPDPDITKFKISELTESGSTFGDTPIQSRIPELPWDKRERYKIEYGMTDKEVEVFVGSFALAKYFEEIILNFTNDQHGNAGDEKKNEEKKLIKLATNYLLSEYLGLLKKKFGESAENIEKGLLSVSTESFAKLVTMVASAEISSRGFKDVLVYIFENGGNPVDTVQKLGLKQNHDEAAIEKIVEELLGSNNSVILDYKAGKLSALQFLIGQGMKLTKGAANPEMLKKLILKKLG